MNFYKRHWRKAIFFGLFYILVTWLSQHLIPHPPALFPAVAIGLSALFLEGLELWPVVYLASLAGALLGKFPVAFIIILPIAQTAQAFAGAYLMRKSRLDPIFRRSRDIFLLIGIAIVVSVIAPTLDTLTSFLNIGRFSAPFLLSAWSLRYASSVLCILVITPFLLRWFSKPRFSRTQIELIETFLVFIALIILSVLTFSGTMPTFGDIPAVYLLLIPLFWIALRLRPRFVTLALVITSSIAISSLYLSKTLLAPALFNVRLFQIEEFLIALAIIFLIIVSLEEDRRLHANLLKSQVATLENAVVRISSESSAKNDFIAVLAHELRNPLAPIVSGIDLLKMHAADDKNDLETLVMMEDRMHTVRRLLDDLLDISRISEGKLALKKERIDLQAILRRAILSTDHHLKERHQSLVLKAGKNPVWIQGDPVRIEQIFSNLITNASKYSDSGEHISITIKKSEYEAEIIVSDSGIGLEKSALENIFTPFHQAETNMHAKKGLGIGLALVRSFAEMHEGRVIATSEGLGKGSTFRVWLPLLAHAERVSTQEASEEAEPVPTPSRESFVRPQTKNGLLVLVVDDNDAAAGGIGKLLELKGCQVMYAYDGKQAIEQVADFSPDVVLLDLGLPDQDGYAVAKTIRARGYHGRLIALTGFSTEDAKSRGQHAGFEHYLVKPAGLADLQRVIPEIA